MSHPRFGMGAAVLLWAAASLLTAADLYIVTADAAFPGRPERILLRLEGRNAGRPEGGEAGQPQSGNAGAPESLSGGEILGGHLEQMPGPSQGRNAGMPVGLMLIVNSPDDLDGAVGPKFSGVKALYLAIGESYGLSEAAVFKLKQFCIAFKAQFPDARLMVSGGGGALRKADVEWIADYSEGAEVGARSLHVFTGGLSGWASASCGAPGAVIVRDAVPAEAALYWTYLEKGASADAFLKPEPASVLAFIRDNDLATQLLIPPGEAMNVRVPSRWYAGATALDGSAVRLHTEGDGLGFYKPPSQAWELVTMTRPPSGEGFFAENKSVTGKKSWVLDEILAHLQVDTMRANVVLPAYAASTQTLLRLKVGGPGQALQIGISGTTLFSQGQEAYWGWNAVNVEGKPWKGRDLPPIPMLQPQQVRIKPFELRPRSEYQYTLAGEDTVDGVPCVRVEFAPTEAFLAQKLPGWRGSLWVRQDDLSMFRVSRSQVNLSGEVLENEEDLRYARAEGVWVPFRVRNRENLSILGSWTVVEVDITYTAVRRVDNLNAELDRLKGQTRRVMAFREKGWEPLEAEKEKTRYLAFGVDRDPGFSFPLPLGGLAWFSLKPEHQYSFIFAGVLGLGARTFYFGKTSLTLTGFFFAIAGDDVPYRNGEKVKAETVKILPADASASLLFPLTSTLSLSAGLQESYRRYQHSSDADPAFRIPDSGLTSTASLALNWTHGGWTAIMNGEGFVRHSFQEWGYADDPQGHREGERYGLTVGKDLYWSEFNRTHVDVGELGGHDLDRFSNLSGMLVHGFPSGALIGTELTAAHVVQSLIIPQAFNLSLSLDAARYRSPDERTLVGMGLSSFFMGPWDTLVQTDAGLGLSGAGKGWTLRLLFFRSLD